MCCGQNGPKVVEIPVSDVDGGSKQWAAGSANDEPSVTLVESCNLMPITWDLGLIRNVRCVLELVSCKEVVDVIERFQRQRVGGEEDNFVIAVPDGMAVHIFLLLSILLRVLCTYSGTRWRLTKA